MNNSIAYFNISARSVIFEPVVWVKFRDMLSAVGDGVEADQCFGRRVEVALLDR